MEKVYILVSTFTEEYESCSFFERREAFKSLKSAVHSLMDKCNENRELLSGIIEFAEGVVCDGEDKLKGYRDKYGYMLDVHYDYDDDFEVVEDLAYSRSTGVLSSAFNSEWAEIVSVKYTIEEMEVHE